MAEQGTQWGRDPCPRRGPHSPPGLKGSQGAPGSHGSSRSRQALEEAGVESSANPAQLPASFPHGLGHSPVLVVLSLRAPPPPKTQTLNEPTDGPEAPQPRSKESLHGQGTLVLRRQ